MASDKGYPSKERETSREVYHEHVTSQPVREKQWAKDVIAHTAVYEVASDIIEANSTISVVKATALVAKVGDVIKFTSGALADKEVKVLKVSANEIELGELLPSAPAAAVTFSIFRHTYLQADSSGSLSVTAVQGPVKFNLDGVATEVNEDTVTPSNNAPLPVKLTGITGDINITAGDLNVQTSHVGASFDSVRIGDGSDLLAINTSGEASVKDADVYNELLAANASLDAIEADMASLDTKIIKADTDDVTVTSSVLPTGAATEAKQDTAITHLSSLAGEDFATQTTLAALLTELQLKADLSETQPVSAASLPLPAGASTAAKQDSALIELQSLVAKDYATQTTLAALLTELQLKADLSETQPVSVASLPLPSGAATAAKQDSIITELQALEAEAVLDVLFFDRHDYSATPVTTSAYVELVASTSAAVKEMQIFDSSGQTLVIAIGAAASEVDKLYVFPGGNGNIKVKIPAASRVSVKAVSNTANAGEISINFLG